LLEGRSPGLEKRLANFARVLLVRVEKLSGGVEAVLNIDNISTLKGATIITGFRGFGMVGYLVSKYVALGTGSEKIGFIIAKPMPPMLLVEEDSIGFPFDIYYSKEYNILTIVNRALPEKENADQYTRAIAEFAARIGSRLMVLAGGLNKNFMEESDAYKYRYLKNSFADNTIQLDAPQMEKGLGVMGPLALLFIYSEYYRVPSVVILPYSAVEDVDYDAAIRGIRIIGEKILQRPVDTSLIEKEAKEWLEEKEKLSALIGAMVSQEGGEQEDRHKGMYM